MKWLSLALRSKIFLLSDNHAVSDGTMYMVVTGANLHILPESSLMGCKQQCQSQSSILKTAAIYLTYTSTSKQHVVTDICIQKVTCKSREGAASVDDAQFRYQNIISEYAKPRHQDSS